MAIRCPKCNVEIGDTDFNVATDVAYCRQCKTNYTYSELATRVEPTMLNQAQVPKHVRAEDTIDGLKLTYKRISPAVFFLIPFMCIWSGVSMAGIYIVPLVQGKLKVSQALFGIPFLFGTVVMLAIIFYLLFGRWIILIGKVESYVCAKAGPFQWKRNFELSQLRSVALVDSGTRSNDRVLKAIELRFADDSKYAFGSFIHDNSKNFIAEVLASSAAK